MKKIIIIILVLFVLWIVLFNIKAKKDANILNNIQTVTPVNNTKTIDTTLKTDVDNVTNTNTTTKTSGSGTGVYTKTTGTSSGSTGPGGLKSGDQVIPSGSSGFAPGPCPDKAMC